MSLRGSFPLQLALATAVVGAVIAGLVALGRMDRGASRAEARSAHLGEEAPTGEGVREHPPSKQSAPGNQASTLSDQARSLVPAASWLVADFEGRLMGQAPFSGQMTGACAKIGAPERVAVGLLPPESSDAVRLVLAAPEVSEPFWRCAKKRVLQAGGKEVGKTRGYEVLESPSGVLVRSPGGDLLFGTTEDLLAPLLALTRHKLPSAHSAQPHKKMASRALSEDPLAGDSGLRDPSGAQAPAGPPPLLITLQLPPGWLEAAGQDASRSPLRHLISATLIARADGSATGSLTCLNPGCDELGEFLQRARDDLASSLPQEMAQALEKSLRTHYIAGSGETGRIALSWASPEVPISQLARRLFQEIAW